MISHNITLENPNCIISMSLGQTKQRSSLWYKFAQNDVLDLVNINAYITFGEIMSICSQDIEWKRNFGINQGI